VRETAVRPIDANRRFSGRHGFFSPEPVEDHMMHINSLVAGLLIAFASTALAQAQMSLDVSKITCDQYVNHKSGIQNYCSLVEWLLQRQAQRFDS
jgi:hypothetical protein